MPSVPFLAVRCNFLWKQRGGATHCTFPSQPYSIVLPCSKWAVYQKWSTARSDREYTAVSSWMYVFLTQCTLGPIQTSHFTFEKSLNLMQMRENSSFSSLAFLKMRLLNRSSTRLLQYFQLHFNSFHTEDCHGQLWRIFVGDDSNHYCISRCYFSSQNRSCFRLLQVKQRMLSSPWQRNPGKKKLIRQNFLQNDIDRKSVV